MNKKKAALYICIIIVVFSIFLKPRTVRGECANVIAQVFDVMVQAAATMRNPDDATSFLDRMRVILFNRNITLCDKNSNPIAVPTAGPIGVNPTTDPNAPTPVPGNTGESQYADQLVQLANQYCGGVVSSLNENCMYTFSSIMDSTSISVFKGFPHDTTNTDWKGDKDPPYDTMYLQCVTCARGMPTARGREYAGWKNAKDHANLAVSGYTYYTNIPTNLVNLVPGSLFISTAGTYGHIGYVTEVLRDDQNQIFGVKVFECNWGSNGLVNHGRTVLINSIAGWQKPNAL